VVFSRSGARDSDDGGSRGVSRRREGDRGWLGDHGRISPGTTSGSTRYRISIFLSVFNVHVNRSPVAGVIRDVRYQRGKFLNAMGGNSAEENEQNIVTVEGDGVS